MARPAKYPYKVTVRLSEDGGEHLERQAKIMDVAPAVAARMLIEHPIKTISPAPQFSRGKLIPPTEPEEPQQ